MSSGSPRNESNGQRVLDSAQGRGNVSDGDAPRGVKPHVNQPYVRAHAAQERASDCMVLRLSIRRVALAEQLRALSSSK
jgi:hypothetical protein